MIGRDQELAALMTALAAARDGVPSTMLVGGDAGIGKTRLLTELAEGSSEKVLWGACLPLGERGVPYLALIEIVRSLTQEERNDLPPPLRFLAPGGSGDDPRAHSRAHLFQSVLELFERLAEVGPLIVVIEDLHWADRSTTDLLDFLIGLLRRQRILLVVSFRTDDLTGDHSLRPQLAEWLRRPSVTRLDLEPLSPDEGLRLVTPHLVGSNLTRDEAMRLVLRADGNPFFLEQLAAEGPDLSVQPDRMRDLLLRRTRQVSPDLLRLLRIASAGGTTIDEELLSVVGGVDLNQTRVLLREGIEAQLLTIDDRSCRFRHALLAEALHDDLLPAERREHHAAYAQVLTSRPSTPGERAGHQASAGLNSEALASWVEAGAAAEAQFAFAEALHGYSSALDLWDSSTDPEQDAGMTRPELMRRLAEVAFLSGEFDLACQTARLVLESIDEETDPVSAGLVHYRLARYLCDTPDHGEALEHQRRAVDLIPASPPTPERASVIAGLASILQYEGRYHEAYEASVEAISLATATDAIEAEMLARNIWGNVTCTIDDVELGITRMREVLALAEDSGDALQQMNAHWNIMANLFEAARWEENIEACHELEEIFPRLGMAYLVPDVMTIAVDSLFRLGRWDEAEAMIEAARDRDPTQAELAGLCELYVARGEFAKARELLSARAAVAPGDTETHIFDTVNLAEIELAEGDPGECLDLLDAVLARSEGLDVPLALGYGIAIGLHAAANLARDARVRGQSTEVDSSVAAGRRYAKAMDDLLARPGPADGWKREVGALGTQVEAERARLEGRVDTEAWDRAVNAWLGLSMPYHAAYCRSRWAGDALTSGVARAEVDPVVRELWRYLSELGATTLLEDVMALARRTRIDVGDRYSSDPYGLTDREREVLSWVARGATNRHIAEELYISEKTASVHVSNILRKLTAANRGEAAAIAIKAGLVDIAELGRTDHGRKSSTVKGSGSSPPP